MVYGSDIFFQAPSEGAEGCWSSAPANIPRNVSFWALRFSSRT